MSHFQEVMNQLTKWFVSYEEYKCLDYPNKDCYISNTNLLNYINMYDNDFDVGDDEDYSFSDEYSDY